MLCFKSSRANQNAAHSRACAIALKWILHLKSTCANKKVAHARVCAIASKRIFRFKSTRANKTQQTHAPVRLARNERFVSNWRAQIKMPRTHPPARFPRNEYFILNWRAQIKTQGTHAPARSPRNEYISRKRQSKQESISYANFRSNNTNHDRMWHTNAFLVPAYPCSLCENILRNRPPSTRSTMRNKWQNLFAWVFVCVSRCSSAISGIHSHHDHFFCHIHGSGSTAGQH